MDELQNLKTFRGAIDRPSFMESAGFVPDPWQVEFLESDNDAMLCCSRQSGKSEVVSALAAHVARHRANTLTLMISPSLRQSGEIFRKTMRTYRATGSPAPRRKTELQLELYNGSRILSLPGNEETIVGFSAVDLLIIDEAARVSDDLYYALRPMLAVSGGRLVALSTPFGKRGWFFNEFTGDGEEFDRTKITADQCPRISKEFLEIERGKMPSWQYRQNYFCEFVQTVDSLFDHGDIIQAMATDEEPLFLEGVI